MNLPHQQFHRIAEDHGLDLVLLFGSAARGTRHAHSDLDLAVRFLEPDTSTRRVAALLGDLQEVFSGDEIDLGLINHADPLFLKKITDSCQLLYGDPTSLAELKILAYKRYQDHARFFAMEAAYVDHYLASRAEAP